VAANARSGFLHSSEIAATAHAYPSKLVDNEAYFKRCRFPIEDRDALIEETRLKTRTWCAHDENAWTLAKTAVERVLKKDPSLRDQIDAVIVASGTTTPVILPPETDNRGVADLAPLVLRDLGRDDALGIDIKACYCTGFLRGLELMDGLLASPERRAGLVIATEQGSRLAVAESNRSRFCFLMADAAGCVVLKRREQKPRTGLVDHVGWTRASMHRAVGVGPDGLSTVMMGSKAGAATVEMLIACAKKLLERNKVRPSDVDWLIPIQTHAQVVDALAKALEWPKKKLLWFGDVTGFAGSASIPACLSDQIESGVVRKGDLVLSVAVGAGMNCAGTLYYC
jgi:3-oxoacyl-[acyl-carrier-protein] synthase III